MLDAILARLGMTDPPGTAERSGGKLIQRVGSLPDDVRRAVLSPRADSLRELVGRAPDEVFAMDQHPYTRLLEQRGATGSYSVLRPGAETPGRTVVPDARPHGVIGVSRTVPPAWVDQVFAHEMGHFADSVDPDRFVGELPPLTPDSRRVNRVRRPLAETNARNYRNPSPRVDDYALSGEKERRAQAFANAFDYLQRAASDTTDWRGRAGAAEATAPGTGEFLRSLLAHPIYSNHPLRGSIR